MMNESTYYTAETPMTVRATLAEDGQQRPGELLIPFLLDGTATQKTHATGIESGGCVGAAIAERPFVLEFEERMRLVLGSDQIVVEDYHGHHRYTHVMSGPGPFGKTMDYGLTLLPPRNGDIKWD